MSAAGPTRRIPELDSLRGIAALVVVVHHLHLWPVAALLGTAVDLFFVLSGYLITSIILDNGGRPGFLVNFYARRSLRIWPIYYLTLLVVALGFAAAGDAGSFATLPYYLTYTQWAPLYWGGVWSAPPALAHTWTLAIEEQFYLFWPPLVLLAGRRRTAALALPLALLPVALRAAGWGDRLLLTRCDGLALGALLAAALAGRPAGRPGGDRAWRAAFAIAALGAISYRAWGRTAFGLIDRAWPGLPLAQIKPSVSLFMMTVLYLGVVGFCAVSAGRPALAPLRDRRLSYLGLISYGLYLYHMPVSVAVDHLARGLGTGPAAVVAVDVAKVALTIGLAAASWRLVERPILALKDRFRYDREAAVPLAPARGDAP